MNFSDFLARLSIDTTEADGYLAHCPAHNDSAASLRVAVSDRGRVLVKCRAGCETAAVMSSLDLSLRDLANMTIDTAPTITPATSTDAAPSGADVAALAANLDRWAGALSDGPHPTGEDALTYAESRFGIAYPDAVRLGLGYADDLPGGPRLVVPFRDPSGVPGGYQARALTPGAAVRWLGPKNPDGASWTKVAYFPGASGWDEVLITEGPGDSLTGAGLGYDTIGIRGAGLVTNPIVADTVAAYVGDRLAVICGDGDPSGRTFNATLAQALLARGCRVKVLHVPDGMDLTDWRGVNPAVFSMEVIRAIAATPEEQDVMAVRRERDRDRYPFTDLGNARFVRDFVAANASGAKYSPEAGFFLLHSGIWRPDKLDRVRAYVQEAADLTASIARNLYEQAGTDRAAQDEAKAWLRWATYSQSTRGISAALAELKALPDVATDVNDFDRHPDFLAVANGVVDLRSGELLHHDPALLLTRRVNVEYDPTATAPRWEAFLDEIFPNHGDLPAYIRRLAGYGITGHTVEQCFAVLWGSGANGKSVLTDTLAEVFNELTETTPFSTFEEKQSGGIPNDLAALKGARLVMASEGEAGRPMAEAVLKRVTGRDLIAARFMRKEFFAFRPNFLLLLATNFKPKFRGQDEGLWRRVKLIPFERYFSDSERDHRLGDTLLTESPGILAWAVRGAIEWNAHGLNDPDVVRLATKEYRETSDALTGFLPGVFTRDDLTGAVMDGSQLFNAYLAWADDENLPARDRWTRSTFYSALEERGAAKRKTNRGVGFAGIRRVRESERAASEDSSAQKRAEPAPVALSPSNPTPTTGASLDDVL